MLKSNLTTILNQPASTATPRAEQRATKEQQRVREEQQRVTDDIPILTIPRITDAPPIMQARNPAGKRALKTTPCIHWRQTRANTPGGVPSITHVTPIPKTNAPPVTVRRMPTQAQQRLVSQQATNALTIHEKSTYQEIFTPTALIKHAINPVVHKCEHCANPMVHPVTGETISSYKKLMNDPATAEVWQTAFGKDFGGMAQGNNKTGQKGTDAMFVMTHKDIKHAIKAGKKFTYCNPVVDHRPQKEDPN